MTKIGLMGGSFNPIHNAHIMMGSTAYEEFKLDKILFIPNAHTYYKDDHTGITDEQRLEMVRLAISPYPYMEIDDIELRMGGITYTINTIRELKKLYKDSEFYFIIGGDSLYNLGTWKCIDELFKETIFLSVIRGETGIEESMKLIEEYKKVYSYSDIRLLSMPSMDISSSAIRKMLSEGMKPEGLIPENVYDYIVSNNLYKAKV